MQSAHSYRFTRPNCLHRPNGFVGDVITLIKVATNRSELGGKVSSTRSENDSTIGDDIEGCNRFRRSEGIAVGEDCQIEVKSKCGCRRRSHRQRHERIKSVVAASGHKGHIGGWVIGNEYRVGSSSL